MLFHAAIYLLAFGYILHLLSHVKVQREDIRKLELKHQELRDKFYDLRMRHANCAPQHNPYRY
jgi:hypothetical protein